MAGRWDGEVHSASRRWLVKPGAYFTPLRLLKEAVEVPPVTVRVRPCRGRSAFFFFQAEDGIRGVAVTGVQTCALPICGERGLGCRPFREGGDSRGHARRPRRGGSRPPRLPRALPRRQPALLLARARGRDRKSVA